VAGAATVNAMAIGNAACFKSLDMMVPLLRHTEHGGIIGLRQMDDKWMTRWVSRHHRLGG